MVNPDDFVIEQCYFMESFYDQNLKIPKIRTVIYIGKNVLEKKEADEWYFQDAGSFMEHGSFSNMSKGTERDIFVLDKDALSLVYDLDGLISDLTRLKKGVLGKRPEDL